MTKIFYLFDYMARIEIILKTKNFYNGGWLFLGIWNLIGMSEDFAMDDTWRRCDPGPGAPPPGMVVPMVVALGPAPSRGVAV